MYTLYVLPKHSRSPLTVSSQRVVKLLPESDVCCTHARITELPYIHYVGCPTTYQTRQFFNNSKTNEDIATRFEQEYVRIVRNEKECVCSKIMSVCV